jgi:hypothetical protein
MKHRVILRDNYCSITTNDLYYNTGINDKKVKIFIKERQMIYQYLVKQTIQDIGQLFADAYSSKNYDEIEKYINDNNIVASNKYDMKILHNKAGMRRIIIETIQEQLFKLKINKYIIHRELFDHFKKVFAYCIKKNTLQYITDFFIHPNNIDAK